MVRPPSLLLGLLDLGPGVAQRHGPVEDQRSGFGIDPVDAERAELRSGEPAHRFRSREQQFAVALEKR
jgi:hypothetical protein